VKLELGGGSLGRTVTTPTMVMIFYDDDKEYDNEESRLESWRHHNTGTYIA
jgi:hypothetical protein